eukprot:CAMPEP_0177640548 /NCGR_PEP_ID=MMETSP0447-20121125/6601_1 /TAXON_ID=0 /ORGANISM="Stygamoeba regulata, Strain BSH-02190019" /LENGTH=362 /DNA_ID=CAMNT_0019142625 /DNA_START=516 /DNA_END=1604 /DNA_ORIENTATION=+
MVDGRCESFHDYKTFFVPLLISLVFVGCLVCICVGCCWRRFSSDDFYHDPASPLDDEQIAGIPTAVYSAGMPGLGEDNDRCCICLENYEPGVLLRELPCGHFYHQECVDTWLRESGLCPLCKQPVFGPKEDHLYDGTTSFLDRVENDSAEEATPLLGAAANTDALASYGYGTGGTSTLNTYSLNADYLQLTNLAGSIPPSTSAGRLNPESASANTAPPLSSTATSDSSVSSPAPGPAPSAALSTSGASGSSSSSSSSGTSGTVPASQGTSSAVARGGAGEHVLSPATAIPRPSAVRRLILQAKDDPQFGPLSAGSLGEASGSLPTELVGGSFASENEFIGSSEDDGGDLYPSPNVSYDNYDF